MAYAAIEAGEDSLPAGPSPIRRAANATKALGLLNDNLERARSAVEYLEGALV